jgi:hypothetical protein
MYVHSLDARNKQQPSPSPQRTPTHKMRPRALPQKCQIIEVCYYNFRYLTLHIWSSLPYISPQLGLIEFLHSFEVVNFLSGRHWHWKKTSLDKSQLKFDDKKILPYAS